MSYFVDSIPLTSDRKMSIITHLNNYAASLQVQIEDARENLAMTVSDQDNHNSYHNAHISNLETLLAEVTDNAQFVLGQ